MTADDLFIATLADLDARLELGRRRALTKAPIRENTDDARVAIVRSCLSPANGGLVTLGVAAKEEP